MKNKAFIIVLVSVILAGAMVLIGCDLGCPGDGTSGGANNCKYTLYAANYYQCTDSCITDQGTYMYGTVYAFNSSKSCKCL